ncbi:MAG: hypothetical protein D8H99_41175, partial [Streptococcus sp.]
MGIVFSKLNTGCGLCEKDKFYSSASRSSQNFLFSLCPLNALNILIMINRYSRPEMAAIWTEENKYRAWLEVEILADEAW